MKSNDSRHDKTESSKNVRKEHAQDEDKEILSSNFAELRSYKRKRPAPSDRLK